MSKKLIGLALALAMIVLVFASCAKKEPAPGGETTDRAQNTFEEESETEYYLDTLTKDLGGFEQFNIMTIQGNIPSEAAYEGKNAVAKALYLRDVTLSDYYGVNLDYTSVENNNKAITSMRNAVTSGENFYHAFITSAVRLMNLAREGNSANLNNVENLNLSGEWWNQSLIKDCTANDKIYCLAGPYSEYYYHSALCMAFNKTLAEDVGIGDIYNDVTSQKWTLEKMKSYCTDYNVVYDRTGDGLGEGDRYAVSAFGSVMYGVFASIGGKFSTFTNDGDIQVTTGTPDAQNLISRLSEVFNSTTTSFSEYEPSALAFNSENALFLYTSTGYIHDYLRQGTINYGIIPCPKLDETQKDYITCAWPSSNYCVSVPYGLSAAASSFAGLMLEAYCFLSYEIVRPVKYESVMLYKVSLDKTAYSVMDMMFRNLYFDMNLIFDFGGSRSLVGNTLRDGKVGQYVSDYTGITGKISDDIQKLLTNGQE